MFVRATELAPPGRLGGRFGATRPRIRCRRSATLLAAACAGCSSPRRRRRSRTWEAAMAQMVAATSRMAAMAMQNQTAALTCISSSSSRGRHHAERRRVWPSQASICFRMPWSLQLGWFPGCMNHHSLQDVLHNYIFSVLQPLCCLPLPCSTCQGSCCCCRGAWRRAALTPPAPHTSCRCWHCCGSRARRR